ncbi:ChaN family lipoprotein [Roseateles sp. GG27B]
MAGGKVDGWQWEFYRPYIALALRYRLPISAANVSRTELRGVMRDGLAASGFDSQVPEPLLQTLAESIEASHCGMLDNATARRMALAQVARDQFMARVVERHADRGVLLLAGNGHVRTDVGAPRWLSAATRARSEAVGVLEAGDTTAAFDRLVFTPAQPRPDPCEAFRPAAKP